MESGRTAGEGREGRGLVAGVRAAFRARPREASKPGCETHLTETHSHLPSSSSASSTRSQRSPRSPILGWRKLKHKENHKGKECARSQEAQLPERNGQCSRSQALRLSHHSSANYPNYTLSSFPGLVTFSKDSNDPLNKNIKNSIRARELSPSWQVSKVTLRKVEESDGTGSCSYENPAMRCVNPDVMSNAPQDKTSDVKEATASSDTCGDQHDKVISPMRKWRDVEGEGEHVGRLCKNHTDNDALIETLLSDDAIQDNRCLDEVPLTREREPWLRTALNYSLRVPQCPRNEVVVLALGVDQYVEEVFQFLDQTRAGKICIEDFHALCRVLGLQDEAVKIEGQKCKCLGSTLTLLGSLNDSTVSGASLEASCPVHLSFREFREKLCDVFIRNAEAHSLLSLGARRPGNSPLVNSVVSVQRRYEVLEAITRKLTEVTTRLMCEEERSKEKNNEPVCGNCQQVIHVDRNSNISPSPRDIEVSYLQRQVLLQQQELQCLREVIDDLRVALQSSDAENLALQVQVLRLTRWRQESSLQDLSLSDEENTIDNLVRQLAELGPQSQGAPPTPPPDEAKEINEKPASSQGTEPPKHTSSNTSFPSGDASLEGELQATYEALQAAREEQEATQADLQETVSQLQQREADLRKVESSLQTTQSALDQAHTDNLNLVTEVAEARTSLEDSRCKVAQALNDLKHTKDIILQKEKQLDEMQARLQQLKDSNGKNSHHTLPCLQSSSQADEEVAQHLSTPVRARVVARVGTARELVAGSLDQVKAGEQALLTLAAHTAYTRLDDVRRADSGLYSEDSERDEDTCPDRSSEHASASEEDLWSLKESDNTAKSHPAPETPPLTSPWIGAESSSSSSSSSSSDDGYKTEAIETIDSPQSSPFTTEPTVTSAISSTEIIEGLERELEWLQYTLNEAEKEFKEVSPQQVEEEPVTAEMKPAVEVRMEEDDNARLASLEDQLKQLLGALMSVADMNLSRRALGRLVLEAVQDASGQSSSAVRTRTEDEEPPISLLTRLLSSMSLHDSASQGEESTAWPLHNTLDTLTHPSEARERLKATMG